jgi:hypothetical protein
MDEIRWRKSTYSSNGGASCIEVGQATHTIAVRDTKQHGRGPVLRFTPAAWRRFAERVKGARKLGEGSLRRWTWPVGSLPPWRSHAYQP